VETSILPWISIWQQEEIQNATAYKDKILLSDDQGSISKSPPSGCNNDGI
jgi:hypothetical protein